MSDFLEDSKVFVNKVIKYESIDIAHCSNAFFMLLYVPAFPAKKMTKPGWPSFRRKLVQAGLF